MIMKRKVENWKKSYTWVLLANVIYIFIFILLMKLYS